MKVGEAGHRVARRDHGEGKHYAGGFSLVSCLVVNALALALLAGLFAASADLIGAARASSALSDQAMRARQVIRFIEHAMASAHMPAEWLTDAEALQAPQGWTAPSPICQPLDTVSPRLRWGGVDVVAMAEVPCVVAGDAEWGLYIEQVHTCPANCGTEAGYVVSPVDCVELNPLIQPNTQWRVAWQENMDPPAHCNAGWPWGRLERMLLSDRSAETSIEASPTLRLQSVVRELPYRWQPSETLVAGIAGWRPAVFPSSRAPHELGEMDPAALHVLSMGFGVIPDQGAAVLPVLRLRRLLFPQAPLRNE